MLSYFFLRRDVIISQAEWDDEEVNNANWDFHPGQWCEDLGYTEECDDGSFRLPGEC